MPVVRSVAPSIFKAILEKYAYEIAEEDEYNWVLVREKEEPPLILPKKGDLVTIEIMDSILGKAKMDNGTYLRLLQETENTLEPTEAKTENLPKQ